MRSHVIHYGKPPIQEKEEMINYQYYLFNDMWKMCINFCNTNNNKLLFLDRAHLGECVYGKIYRKYSNQETENILRQEKRYLKFLQKNLILFTIIDNNIKELLFREDGFSFSNNENDKKKEFELFKEIHDKSNIENKTMLDLQYFYEDDSHKVNIDKILTFMKTKIN